VRTFLSMLDFWDYVMFGSLFIVVVFSFMLVIFILGLPGKIAIARNHPDAEAVNLMGWVGFMAIVPWIQALIWAFKPTDVIDVRRFPKEERKAIEEEIAKLSGAGSSSKPARPRVSRKPEKS
jgi:hypothetical protein